MMEITYDSIKHLIKDEKVEGTMVTVNFQDANMAAPLMGVGVVTPDQDEIMKNAMKGAGKSAAVGIGASIAGNALGSAIGGIGGSIARSATTTAASVGSSAMMQNDMKKAMNPEMTEERKQKAIVQAFTNLQMFFKNEGGAWRGLTQEEQAQMHQGG